ncbi:multisubstrate pseudouridine synthase 7 [Phlyctochytrium planicorne]|nr:multisubstrate pseudouridine synthase 7 [Phlyctochytrium planicorne]
MTSPKRLKVDIPPEVKGKLDGTTASASATVDSEEEDLIHKPAACTSAHASAIDEYIKSLSVGSFQPKSGKSYLTELDVGISAFVQPSVHSLTGIIKQRFSDFLVNEVDYTGKILHLEHLGEEKTPESKGADVVEIPKVIAELSALVGEDPGVQQLELILKDEVQNFEPIFLQPVDSKDKRKVIHEFFKSRLPEKVVTDSMTDFKIRIRPMDPKQKGKERVNRKLWETLGGEYLEFILYKENRDTMEILSHIAKFSGTSSKAYTFAGTKDKRGVTVQRVTGHKVLKESLIRAAPMLRGVKLGNFRYVPDAVKLGDLRGNHFVITLRNVQAKSEVNEPLENLVNSSMTSLKEKGFVNFYGMQRFGTRSISTHTVGVAMLAERWDVAVDLILMPKGDDREDLARAREHWASHRDPAAALDMFPRNSVAERAVLLSLVKQKGKNNYFQALSCIPRNLRLMYIHAVQSYVWNHMASERINRFGTRVVVGDLVVVQKPEGEKIMPVQIDEQDTEDGDGMTAHDSRLSRMFEVEYITTQEEADKRSINEVVLPLPGYTVKYPKNEIGELYASFMATFGLDPHKMKRKNREISLSGDYRRLLTKPDNVKWNIYSYNDPDVPLSLTDVDVLEGKPAPISVDGGSKIGMVCEFTLESSCYATMALREILKADTSAGFQTELNIEERKE